MTHTEKCIALYNKKVNQTNEWRIEVFHAMRVKGRKVAQIAIIIRKDKVTSVWDGIGNTDKKIKSLSRIVSEALKMVNWNIFNITREKKFLKRNYP